MTVLFIWYFRKKNGVVIKNVPTCRHQIYVMRVCRQYRMVVKQYRHATCRHAQNGIIVHLIFSNKKIGVVIKTWRHADTICMSCVFVSNIGGGVKPCLHADMPTCRQYPMFHLENCCCYKNMTTCRHHMYICHVCLSAIYDGGQTLPTCRHVDMPTSQQWQYCLFHIFE